MTADVVAERIDELRYVLDDVDTIIRGLRKEWFEKGNYISVLRLRVSDLLDALNDLTSVEMSILGG